MRPVSRAPGARVQVFNNLPPGVKAPTKEASAARVRLKLYALAYVESRHGIDSTPALCWDALVIYCQAAINYVASLEGKSKLDLVDRALHSDRDPSNVRTMLSSDRVAAARTELKIAALGYESTRRGADAYTQGAQSGIAMVCQAAIRYVEALEGGSDRSKMSSNLHLED